MNRCYLISCKDQIEKVLTLQDRNEFSNTYGCFDRNYWHYKTRDFPSAMSQEYTLVLALAYSVNFDKNIYYKNKNVYKWILSGMNFLMNHSRLDGSLDDYYPYERALGAAVFTTYAFTESCILLGVNNESYNNYFHNSISWMKQANESGVLTNHHAIQAVCYLNMYKITDDKEYLHLADNKITAIIKTQNKEGWFPEYEGCSPGYLTVTIDYLAQFFSYRPSKQLKASILQAIKFLHNIQHPDGTCGGDYGSRNTSFFHPNGFEIMSSISKEATEIANSYLLARSKNLFPIQQDDYTIGHGLISNLNAYKNCNRENFENINKVRSNFIKTYDSAGLRVIAKDNIWSIFNVQKGGVGKIYSKNKLIFRYAGIVIKNKNKYYVNNSVQPDCEYKITGDSILINSRFTPYKQKVPTLYNYFIFRLFLIVFGRFETISRLVRKILQNLLIYKRSNSHYHSETKIILTDDALRLKIKVSGKFNGNEEVFASDNFVPMYTAMSEYYSLEDLKSHNSMLEKKEDAFVFENSYKL